MSHDGYSKPTREELEDLNKKLIHPVDGVAVADRLNRCPDYCRRIRRAWQMTVEEDLEKLSEEEEQAAEDNAESINNNDMPDCYFPANIINMKSSNWREPVPVLEL